MSSHCRLCGRQRTKSFVTLRDEILYHRCLSCGYIGMDEAYILSPEDERRRYLLHENSPDNLGYVHWLKSFLTFALNKKVPDGASILDFGSGPQPVMAELMRDLGYTVSTEDSYFAPGRAEGPFDLITAVEVFEHLLFPADVMKSLAERLLPGGKLCLCTEFLQEKTDFFDTWHYRSDPTHIGFFTVKALVEAGRKCGLEKSECDNRRYIAFTKTPC